MISLSPRLLVALAATVAASGCATITRGTTEAWTVETDPVGASVSLSSGENCTTPCTLKKKRKDAFQVTLKKDGYQSVETQVLSQTSGAGAAGMAGNVIIGGLIGIGVDAASGATKDLKPNPLVVKLEPIVSAASDQPVETLWKDGAEALVEDADAFPDE
jgi:hypothetical protein